MLLLLSLLLAAIFSILLVSCKLALVASFKENVLLNFKFKNEASRANLQVNERKLKYLLPFWNKVYTERLYYIFLDQKPA